MPPNLEGSKNSKETSRKLFLHPIKKSARLSKAKQYKKFNSTKINFLFK
jgi:hypothetical protein